MPRLYADLFLLLASFIWGTAFIAQKHANDAMGPVGFVGARFLLSCFALAPLAYREHKKNDPIPLTRRDLLLAAVIGLCLFCAASLQQIGLVTTTATNGGFLTALYVFLVPPMVWMLTGARPRRIVLFASAVSVVGAWLLTETGRFQGWTSGDALILAADVAWAAGISLVPLFLARTERPFFLAFAQFGVTALLGLAVGFGVESFSSAGLIASLPSLLYAGVLSGGVAFTLQILAQAHTPPAEAALIMSLESVFAALSGVALLSERLTGLAVLGCVLILLGVISVEAGPALRNLRRRLRARPSG